MKWQTVQTQTSPLRQPLLEEWSDLGLHFYVSKFGINMTVVHKIVFKVTLQIFYGLYEESFFLVYPLKSHCTRCTNIISWDEREFIWS